MDDQATVRHKIKQAFCERCNVKRNGVLSIAENVIFPNLRDGCLVVEKYSEESVTFDNFQSLRDAFEKGDVHPTELKKAVIVELDRLLDPVRTELARPEVLELERLAYSVTSDTDK